MKKKIELFIITFVSILFITGCGVFGLNNNHSSHTERTLNETQSQSTTDDVYVSVGDIVTFGSYEQNHNYEDGKEKIRWIVISEDDNTYQLLSEYIIDAHSYNDTLSNVTWETCSLRFWLNNDFFNSAFNIEEQSKIVLSDVIAISRPDIIEDGRKQGTDGGNSTKDYVYLIAPKTSDALFFNNNNYKRAYVTEEQYNSNCYINGYNGYSEWWIRCPGYELTNEAYVDTDGNYWDLGTGIWGLEVDTNTVGIRPCITVDKSALNISNNANNYEFTYEQLMDIIKQNIDEMASYSKKPVDLNATGFDSIEEAQFAMIQALNNEDCDAYVDMMPWPVFYKYVDEPYIEWIHDYYHFNKIGIGKAYNEYLEFDALNTKTDEYRWLKEHYYESVFVDVRSGKDFSCWGSLEKADSSYISEYFTTYDEAYKFHLVNENDSYMECYVVSMDGKWYVFTRNNLFWDYTVIKEKQF